MESAVFWVLLLFTNPVAAMPGFHDQLSCEKAYQSILFGVPRKDKKPEHQCIKVDPADAAPDAPADEHKDDGTEAGGNGS